MKKVLSAIVTIAVLSLLVGALFAYIQICEVQNRISELQDENNELRDQNNELWDQIRVLELENLEKQDRLTDFTHELAKTRHLYVELTSFSWGSSGPIVGLLIQYDAIITVQNNDVIPVSGLTLTLSASHKNKGTQIGQAGVTRIGKLNAGEMHEISGSFCAIVGTSFEDAIFHITLSIGDRVLDEKLTSEFHSFGL
jgi:cell division protein FtsB